MAEAFSSQHTNTFPDFLAQTGISLLVSTYQAGKLILLRHQDGVLNTHFVDMPKPMGIALQEPHLAVGTGHQLVHYFDMPDVATRVEPYNTHNACYVPREMHITGDIDIHEMAFSDTQMLWLINTKMSCLCTVLQEYSVVPRWRPPFISGYDLTDRCHLNGLAMKNGKPAYVSALGTTDTAAGWRKDKASGGIIMDINTNQMIASGLSMPHSPRWYQDQLWVLESGAGSLATVDLETGKLTTIVELPGFTRGIDFLGRYAVIGLSQVRETAVFAGLPLTERCQERQCGVYIIDIIDKKVVGFVVFSGEVQEIFSVKVLPARFPAVLSMDDPLLRSTYSIPDEALQDFSGPEPDQIRLEEANVLYTQGKFDEAIGSYKTFLEDYPEKTVAWLNLGLAYLGVQQWKNAVEVLQKVVAGERKHADAYNSLGKAWSGLHNWDKAMASFKQAISIDQQYATAHVNRALLLLRLGQFKEGWRELEWRWKMPGIQPFDCLQPQWNGEDISDKRVLVHTEQTNSDVIQFARFLPLLAERCNTLIVACTEPFRLFFKSIDGVDEVRLLGTQIPKDSFDAYVPIMSLPGALGITLNSLPAETPYWNIPAEVVVTTLRSQKRLKVGLVWKGNFSDFNNTDFEQPEIDKSDSGNHDTTHSALDQFLPLVNQKNIEFYSVQMHLLKEEAKRLAQNKIINLEPELVSYAHAGALISQLDLLISVDSSLAHLSASLGIPVWLLLTENPDWRWMVERDDSPWYPQIRIFRQDQNQGPIAGMQGLVLRVKKALSTHHYLL